MTQTYHVARCPAGCTVPAEHHPCRPCPTCGSDLLINEFHPPRPQEAPAGGFLRAGPGMEAAEEEFGRRAAALGEAIAATGFTFPDEPEDPEAANQDLDNLLRHGCSESTGTCSGCRAAFGEPHGADCLWTRLTSPALSADERSRLEEIAQVVARDRYNLRIGMGSCGGAVDDRAFLFDLLARLGVAKTADAAVR